MNESMRMKELIARCNEASKAYYQMNTEIMSNYEYDALYDELLALEEKTGIVYANSPTQKVGYELLSELTKERHPSPMLSLDKTKDVAALAEWTKGHDSILSWKMDGLTIVVTYENGKLIKAVTRGNGEVGEVITNNAKVFSNIPSHIPFLGQVVIRGEAVIRYSDFEKINASIPEGEMKYKNPRNLCSGSVRQLNNEITAKRNVNFFAFCLVSADGIPFSTIEEQFLWLKEQGFTVVEYEKVNSETMEEAVHAFARRIEENDFPSDGLVLTFDDIAYGLSLGRTAKFPRNAIAFKWQDETANTILREVEWSPSRTGLINPVAIFDPVELEGTTVSRASLHNISICENLKLGIGDEITVFKANMIIPQVAENLTASNTLVPVKHCPACGSETKIKEENGVKALYCPNQFCSAKKIKLFSHFVGRDAMNIEGLSEATLEKMIDRGLINELPDLYHLSQYETQIKEMEGFGEKSYDNLIQSIEKSRKTALFKFIYSLGILNVGLSNAKLICKYFDDDLEKIRNAKTEEMIAIEGFGEVIAGSVRDYFTNEHNNHIVDELKKELEFEKTEIIAEQTLDGKTFVITGSLFEFTNRNACKEAIEQKGGKVTGSVTKKTDYLVNNDVASTSSKNKKAKDLGIPIIDEKTLLSMLK